jgi:methylenetetrahydrofolate reductase (NADPH)
MNKRPKNSSAPFPICGVRPKVSFEFFPPHTPEMAEKAWAALLKLAPLKPRFVSVTYGAGGSTRERTHAQVARIRRETDLEPAAHLTCVDATRLEVDQVARSYWQAGVRHIVAIRGDPPQGSSNFRPTPGGYANSTELVAGLRALHPFEISVGCYPERHPDSPSWAFEIDHLKRKIAAGAARAISQYFFDANVFFRFLDRARAAGITVPIVPGLMPVLSLKQVVRFSKQCGASVPAWLVDLFEGLEDDQETRRHIAVAAAAEQCRRLSAGGVEEFHFYTLNRADLVYPICVALGLRAAKAGVAASVENEPAP